MNKALFLIGILVILPAVAADDTAAIHGANARLLTKTSTATTPVTGPTCPPGAVTLFHCLTAKGKRIQLCDEGKTLEYSFGHPEKQPEMVVRVPRAKASTTQWQNHLQRVLGRRSGLRGPPRRGRGQCACKR